MSLLAKHCVPCEGGVPPITPAQIAPLKQELTMEWAINDGKELSREFRFKNFKDAVVFVNAVADIAEQEGHHPDIHIRYNNVTLRLSTHAIQGLSENDFILARKIEEIAPT